MFRASSAHLQEDTVVYMQHVVLSPGNLIERDSTICCMYTTVSFWRWALEARNVYRRI